MFKFSTIIGFPSDKIPQELKKQRGYMNQIAQAIYSRWYNGRTLYGHTATGWFQMMCDYSEGRQSSAPYRDWFVCITNDKNATERNFTQYARKAYANVNYEIVSPAPKFVSTIKSLLSASDFKVNCQSLSPTSTFEKQKKKWRLFLPP